MMASLVRTVVQIAQTDAHIVRHRARKTDRDANAEDRVGDGQRVKVSVAQEKATAAATPKTRVVTVRIGLGRWCAKANIPVASMTASIAPCSTAGARTAAGKISGAETVAEKPRLHIPRSAG